MARHFTNNVVALRDYVRPFTRESLVVDCPLYHAQSKTFFDFFELVDDTIVGMTTTGEGVTFPFSECSHAWDPKIDPTKFEEFKKQCKSGK